MQQLSFIPISIFKRFVTPEIVNLIVRETNRTAESIIREWNAAHSNLDAKVWAETSETEMYAFFGLLLFAGMFNSNTQPAKELWKPYHHDIYKATMSLSRFKLLLRCSFAWIMKIREHIEIHSANRQTSTTLG